MIAGSNHILLGLNIHIWQFQQLNMGLQCPHLAVPPHIIGRRGSSRPLISCRKVIIGHQGLLVALPTASIGPKVNNWQFQQPIVGPLDPYLTRGIPGGPLVRPGGVAAPAAASRDLWPLGGMPSPSLTGSKHLVQGILHFNCVGR